MTFENRLGIAFGGLYGAQLPRTLIRRVASPEVPLPALSTRQLVEWNPGEYFGFDLAPIFRLSPELSIIGEYSFFKKLTDAYQLAGSSIGAPLDPVVMELESGITAHEIGGTLRYDTVARWRQAGDSRPMQLHLRIRKAIAGGGGQTPITTRVEFGVRVFQRFWGAP